MFKKLKKILKNQQQDGKIMYRKIFTAEEVSKLQIEILDKICNSALDLTQKLHKENTVLKSQLEDTNTQSTVKAKADENQEIRDIRKEIKIINFILNLIPLSEEFKKRIKITAIANALYDSEITQCQSKQS